MWEPATRKSVLENRSSFRRVIVPHVSRESLGLRVWVLDAPPVARVVRRSGSCGPQVKPLSPRGSRARKENWPRPSSDSDSRGLLPSVPMITARRPSRRSLAFGAKRPQLSTKKIDVAQRSYRAMEDIAGRNMTHGRINGPQSDSACLQRAAATTIGSRPSFRRSIELGRP